MFSPCVLFLAIITESPRHDVKKGNWDRAEKTIRTIAQLNCSGPSRQVTLLRETLFVRESGSKTERQGTGLFSALRTIKLTGRVSDFSVVVIQSFTSVFVYYTVGYSMPRFLNEGYCYTTNVTVQDSCVFNKAVLLDLGLISLFEPLGVLVAVIFVEIVGRKRMFQSSVALLVVALSALYFCVNTTYSFIFFTLSKYCAAQIGWSTFLLGSENFPTEIRSFVLAICVSCQRIGGCVGIACSQFLFNVTPRLVLGVTQVGAIVVWACLLAWKQDATGSQIV